MTTKNGYFVKTACAVRTTSSNYASIILPTNTPGRILEKLETGELLVDFVLVPAIKVAANSPLIKVVENGSTPTG